MIKCHDDGENKRWNENEECVEDAFMFYDDCDCTISIIMSDESMSTDFLWQ
jgi:hypothetical protein